MDDPTKDQTLLANSKTTSPSHSGASFAPAASSSSPSDAASAQPAVKSSLNMMLIVPLIIIVIAIAVGAVWFMSASRTSQTGNAATSPVPSTATPAQGLESELNAIDVESDDSEFADVDRDLKSL